MPERNLVGGLMRRSAEWQGPVLSAYLTVDPSIRANLFDAWRLRLAAALHGLETQLADHPESAESLRSCADDLCASLSAYRPSAKTLIIMRDSASGEEWRREMQTPVAEVVEWSESPDVQPLVEAMNGDHGKSATDLRGSVSALV